MSDDEAFDLTSHLLADQFSVVDGVLAIGGVRVSEIARESGTPFYAYDRALLQRQYQSLRSGLPERVEIYYSVKANPNAEVIRTFVGQGAGLEVASGGEYRRARAAGCPADRILFAGPGKRREELELVVRDGIGEIHVETREEIEDIDALAREAGRVQEVAVRVNPIAAGSGGAMRMGGQPAPFGFDEEVLEGLLGDLEQRSGLRVGGIHMFAGTQVLDANVLLTQWTHAIELARKVTGLLGRVLDTVDLGGGLGIPYFSSDRPLDVEVLAAGASELFDPLVDDKSFRGTRFIVEPGRFLAGPSGVYVARVLSVKRSRDRTFVVTDGGMHHHLAASGNLGQVIKRDYPIVNATRVAERGGVPVSVVGPLCTPLDTLGRKAPLPASTRTGDLIAILQSGAYGLTASPMEFLSHPRACEVLLYPDRFEPGAAESTPPGGRTASRTEGNG